MTLREAQALLLLYQACSDVSLRSRAARFVPELEEWDNGQPVIARRWRLVALVGGQSIGSRNVICAPIDLEVYKRDFLAGFDLAVGATVGIEEI